LADEAAVPVTPELMEALFGSRARSYDEVVPFFRPIAARLAQAIVARTANAARVAVDVASGKSALAEALVGLSPTTHVIAGDLSFGMVAVAAEAAHDRVHLVQADAERLPIHTGCADLIGCSTSVRFFGDPAVALGEMRRVLRVGGVVGLSELGTVDPPWAFVGDVLRRHQRTAGIDPRSPRTGPVRHLALETLAAAARFEAVRSSEGRITIAFSDAQAWWQWIHSLSQGYLVDQLGEGVHAFRDEVTARVAELTRAPFGQTFRIVTGIAD
jgi:ubiquinone/menaquinone biosynthesis C-methylase UbiE